MASCYTLLAAAVLDANLEIYPNTNLNPPTKLVAQFYCKQPLVSVDPQLGLVTEQVENHPKI